MAFKRNSAGSYHNSKSDNDTNQDKVTEEPKKRFSFYEVEDTSFLDPKPPPVTGDLKSNNNNEKNTGFSSIKTQNDNGDCKEVSSISEKKIHTIINAEMTESSEKTVNDDLVVETMPSTKNNMETPGDDVVDVDDNNMDIENILRSLKESEAYISGRKFSGYSSFDAGHPSNFTDHAQQQQQQISLLGKKEEEEHDTMEINTFTQTPIRSNLKDSIDEPQSSPNDNNLTNNLQKKPMPAFPPKPETPKSGSISYTSVKDTNNENLDLLDASSEATILQQTLVANNTNIEYMSDKRKDSIESTQSAATDVELSSSPSSLIMKSNAMEAVVRNALHHIRVRAQRRTHNALSPHSPLTIMPSKPQNQTVYAITTPTKENYNDVLSEHSLVENNDISGNTALSDELSNKEREIKARRARMADYAARLQSSSVSETEQNSPSATTQNSSFNPLSLYPSKEETNNPHPTLIPATQYDDRLLSPAIDVRKTVEVSYNMFRPNNSGDGAGPPIDLANPILSFTPGKNARDGVTADRITEPIPFELGQQGHQTNHTSQTSKDTSTQLTNNLLATHPPSVSDKNEIKKINNEPQRNLNTEEVIERGVESVLVAILEHAGRKANEASSVIKNKPIEDDGGDIIEKAFASLYIQKKSESTGTNVTTEIVPSSYKNLKQPNSDMVRGGIEDVGTEGLDEQSMQFHDSSLVDELLAEEDEAPSSQLDDDKYSIDLSMAQTNNTSTNKFSSSSVPQDNLAALIDNVLQRNEIDDLHFEADLHSDLNEVNFDKTRDLAKGLPESNEIPIVACSVSQDGMIAVEAIHESEPPENMCHQENDEIKSAVLGPLSKKMGGTTGVVLDDEKGNESDEGKITPTDPDSRIKGSPESLGGPLSPSIIHSLTSVVRNAKILNVFSNESSHSHTKLATNKPRSEIDSDNEDEVDEEANALMRDICSHLLPYDQSANDEKTFGRWLTGIQRSWSTENILSTRSMWNDDDPDEPGYEIKKLSKSQLRRVESEFERIINKVRQNSEQNLMKRKESSSFSGTLKKSIRKRISLDTQQNEFERDLAEAEDILDREEQRHQAEEKATEIQRKDLESKCDDSTNLTTSLSRDISVDSEVIDGSGLDDNPLATNPCFPSIKAAGRGKIGELEIYHLPIIYKAKQTGFEPTKDLVLHPGSVFSGQYFVQSELGSAAFSTTYRCVDLTSGKKAEDGEEYYDEVCLKVIKNTKDFFDQSLDEIKILELLRQTGKCHENNVVELKAYFYHKEHLVIVTELLRQNLFEFGKYIIENEEPPYFTRPRLCYIARQCLIALDFIHKLGLVHSDIKPENILLSSYSKARVKVIDFGSSCYLTDRQSSYIQSRSYRAPEVILGLPYDGKIDIWSLGCVVAEMYTGEVTFQNDSVVSMLSRIEAICGAFPRHMIENGRQSRNYFTRSGLIYEKCNQEDKDESGKYSALKYDENLGKESMFNIYTPKQTSLTVRLGFDPNLLEQKRTKWQEEEKALFVDFVKNLLTVDPDCRPTASEALEHPWILSGYNIGDEYILYPPE